MNQAALDIEARYHYRFALVEAESVLGVWDEVEPIVRRALDHDYDGMTTNQVLARILLGDLSLLIVTLQGEIIAVMTFEEVSRHEKILHCMTFSGDKMADWVEGFMEIWKRIGKAHGCRYLSIKGRKGWERYAAKKFGFKHAYTQMFLDIED